MKFAPVSRTASGLVRAAILAIALVALLAPAALAEDDAGKTELLVPEEL